MFTESDLEYISKSSSYIGFILLHTKANNNIYTLINIIAGYLLIETIKENTKQYPEILYLELFVIAACFHLVNNISDESLEKKFLLLSSVISGYFIVNQIQKNNQNEIQQ